ncbi:GFA family protein [Jeongeupia wiesaeckerbachi]|uniref:GFA family protein n=1 Tax=Jeongeupia wiesaeckerbachi TaxID=3051218 RepID=UPI003D8016A0
MHSGSCLCGAVSFRLLSEPKTVSNCHCRMCQNQHSAAFTTYSSVPRSDLEYLSGQELLTASVIRKFCSACRSNIEWSGSEKFPDWASITMASIDTNLKPKNIKDVHLESRVCWLQSS